jgi:hypothetical protein
VDCAWTCVAAVTSARTTSGMIWRMRGALLGVTVACSLPGSD